MQRTPATTPVARPAAKTVASLLMTAAALAVMGCGDDPSEVDKFVGVWEYDLSDLRLNCNDGTARTADSLIGVQMEFRLGVKSDLVDPHAMGIYFLTHACDYRYDVAKGQASIDAGQTCTFYDVNDGVTPIGTETPGTVTFGLRGDGTEIDENATWTEVTLDNALNCTTTITGHLKKISKN